MSLAAIPAAPIGGWEGGCWAPANCPPAWVVAQVDAAGRRAVSLVSFGVSGAGHCD
jgi:hypothetical protein